MTFGKETALLLVPNCRTTQISQHVKVKHCDPTEKCGEPQQESNSETHAWERIDASSKLLLPLLLRAKPLSLRSTRRNPHTRKHRAHNISHKKSLLVLDDPLVDDARRRPGQ